MSPLACCKDCPTEADCVDEGCAKARRQGWPGYISLNEEHWADFMHNMLNPKPPTPEMIAAAKMMRDFARKPGDIEYDSWSFDIGDRK